MMKKILSCVIIVAISLSVFAQKEKKASKDKNRLELQLQSFNDQSIVIPMGEAGLLQYYEINYKIREFYIDKYDTNLSKSYQVKIEAGVGNSLIDYYYINEKLVMLFADMGNKSKYFKVFGRTTKFKKYSIVVFDSKNKTQKKIESSFKNKFTLSKLIANDAQACIMGNEGMQPVAQCIDLKSSSEQTVSFLPEGKTKGVLKFVADDEGKNTGNVIVKSDGGMNNVVHYKLLSSGLKIDKTWEIQLEEGKEIGTCKFSASGNYLIGSYQKATRKLSIPELSRSFSDCKVVGVFLAKLVNEKIKFVKYFHLLELDSLYKKYVSYTHPYILNLVKKKFAKDPMYSTEIDVLFSHVIETNDNIYFVGETFQTVNQAWVQYTGFTGYTFKDGFIISMDKDGKVKWNDQFEISNYVELNMTYTNTKLPFNLNNPHSAVKVSGEDVSLSVYTGGYLSTYIVVDDELFLTDNETEFDTKKNMAFQTYLMPWYGAYFIGSGIFDIAEGSGNTHDFVGNKTTVLQKIKIPEFLKEDKK